MSEQQDAQAPQSVEVQPPQEPLALQRFKMIVAYDGAKFHGWQKQEPPGKPALRTVGGVLEQTLQHALRQPINLQGASRTDAGVHARGQVAHFDALPRMPYDRIAMAVNSRLPHDIDVISVEPVESTFNATMHATRKQYCYRLYTALRRPLEKRRYVWHHWAPLDLERMRDAAQRIIGTHDFEGFSAAHHGRVTTVRTVFRCDVLADLPDYPNEIHIVVEGDGFLYNMVRIIVGTLTEVGRGRLEPDVVDQALQTQNRRLLGPTAVPDGLWLNWIRY